MIKEGWRKKDFMNQHGKGDVNTTFNEGIFFTHMQKKGYARSFLGINDFRTSGESVAS
jgi:hypothetical protein